MKSGEGTSKQEVDATTEPAAQGEQQSISANAPAWTPGGIAPDVALPIAPPRGGKGEDASATSETGLPDPETKGGGEVGDSCSVTASETATLEKEGSGEVGDSNCVTVEPKVPAGDMNP